nr:T9SS type B sorting domain-containing protein [uncultured Flavobacterium sp.]
MFSLRFSQIVLLLLFFQIGFSQNDCSDALVVCGNSNFSGLSATGIGVQELSGSNTCASEENNSIWLKVTIETSGTLSFSLVPQSHSITVDFDFFVFGPNVSCGNIGNAIRCSTTNPEAAGQANNHTGMNQTETDTSEGPGAAGNSFVSAINAVAGETYFIVIDRPIGSSNFSLNWTGTATFSEPPTVNNTTAGATLDMSKCDSDSVQDNTTTFDLLQNSPLAIGTQTNITASFHTTANDAITNSNAIPNPGSYQNTSSPQTIYIRLTNTNTGCFATEEFDINVIPYQTNNPANLEECDQDNDGFATFNLRENDAALIGGDTNLTITYHPASNSPVLLPDNYTNQTPFTNETVWAKITDASGCYAYKPFDLIINRIPNVTPAQLTQCDFQLNPDGLTTFNLTEANAVLTGSNTNYTTQFYATLADANNNANALNTTYQNIQNPQVIHVRVTDTTTSCYSFTTLTLNVTVNPTITFPLHECDADGTEDGFVEFDLTDTQFATGGNTVTYFANSSDALLEQNALPTDYTNTVINYQRIYARIENANDCIGIYIVDLFVDKLPNIDIDDNAVFCLNHPGTPVILNAGIGNQNPASFTYLWTPNGETTPTISILASGTYTVTVTNSLGCSKVRTIIVKDSDVAVVENVSVVDLSDNNTVTVYVQGDESEFVYSLDQPNGSFQDSNYFDDVTPGIHIVYISDKDGCKVDTKHEFPVLGIPTFFTPNGDGYHDTWRIKGMEKGHYANSTIYIYDRYGKLLKQMAPGGEGWNGTFNNQMVSATDYWYVMHLEDGRTIKGHFALKR